MKVLLLLLAVSAVAVAEQTKTIYSPFTGKLDYITKIDSSTIVPGSGVTVTCTNGACTINATGGGSGTSPFAGFYLTDSSNTDWVVTIQTDGALTTTVAASVPTGVLFRPYITLQDNASAYWNLTVNTSGNLVTTAGGSSSTTLKDILINDSTGFTWIVTVADNGALTTS